MRQADRVLDDLLIVAPVYEALPQRPPRSRDRPGSPAEMVLRLLALKHVRNWSHEVLEREVRTNLVDLRRWRRCAQCQDDGEFRTWPRRQRISTSRLCTGYRQHWRPEARRSGRRTSSSSASSPKRRVRARRCQ